VTPQRAATEAFLQTGWSPARARWGVLLAALPTRPLPAGAQAPASWCGSFLARRSDVLGLAQRIGRRPRASRRWLPAGPFQSWVLPAGRPAPPRRPPAALRSASGPLGHVLDPLQLPAPRQAGAGRPAGVPGSLAMLLDQPAPTIRGGSSVLLGALANLSGSQGAGWAAVNLIG